MLPKVASAFGALACLLLGCGDGREPLHPAADGAVSCRPLVTRIEKFEHDDTAIDDESPDVAQSIQQGIARFEGAARDITSIPSTDDAVRAFEQRYALYLHGRSAYLLRVGPYFVKLSAGVDVVKKSHAAEEAAAARCGNRTCSEFVAAHQQARNEALAFLVVKAALIADAEEHADADKVMIAQGDQLNEDLKTLCGRPVPRPAKAK